MAHISRCAAIFFGLIGSAVASETKIIVHTATGGNMVHARVFAHHWEKQSGFPVTIKVVPGATGVVAANYLYSVSAKDGSEIAAIDSRITIQSFAKSDGVKFDLTQFTWLGSAVDGRKEPYVLWSKAGSEPLLAGIEGGSSINHVRFLNRILGWNIKEVVGYSDSTQTRLAFMRGEVTAVSYSLTGIRSTNPDWISDSQIIPLVQYGVGSNRNPSLSLIPTLMELAKTDEDRKLVSAFERFLTLSRPFAAPPGLSNEKKMELRERFQQIVNNADYIKDAEKIGVIVSPISGQEAQKIVEDITTQSPDGLRSFVAF